MTSIASRAMVKDTSMTTEIRVAQATHLEMERAAGEEALPRKSGKWLVSVYPCITAIGSLALWLTTASEQDYSSARPPGFGERGGSYGVGMVGVGSGIEAYGR